MKYNTRNPLKPGATLETIKKVLFNIYKSGMVEWAKTIEGKDIRYEYQKIYEERR